MGVSRVSSSKAIQGEWFGLAGLWSPSELSTILSGSLKAVWKQGHAVVRGDREDQAGEGKLVPLTLLSSPYLIMSWAKSSVGLIRTNAWTFFLVPILAKKKKTVQLSAGIIKWQLAGRCHSWKRSEQSDMLSVSSYPTESQSFFLPPSMAGFYPQDTARQAQAHLLYWLTHHFPPMAP